MSGPPYINLADVDTFLISLKEAVEISPEWGNAKTGDMRALTADYLGDAFDCSELGVVFLEHDDEPGRVRVTLHARNWGKNNCYHDVEDAIFEEAVRPLLRLASRKLGRRLRLLKPIVKLTPLRGDLANTFSRFTFQTPSRTIREEPHNLHPLDRMRFHQFIRKAHQYCSVLSPADVNRHLRNAGIGDELASELTDEYSLGRRILAGDWHPWELRARRRQLRARHGE